MSSLFRKSPALLVIAIVTSVTVSPRFASAQAQGDLVPKDLVIVVGHVSDIESLRAINPLNLTADQVGRIEEAVRKATENHMKKITAAAAPLQAMGPEIRDLRTRLLKGGEVPEDFDKKGAKIQEAFIVKRDAEKNRTLKSLSDAIRAVLTPEQVSKVIAVSKKLTKRDGKPTMQGSDDQFFNFFVQAVFIDYPAILPLLDEVKKARSEGAAVKTALTLRNAGNLKVARK
jgi:hypothetical protein